MVCTVKRKCDGLNIVDANNYVYQLDRKCSDKKTYWKCEIREYKGRLHTLLENGNILAVANPFWAVISPSPQNHKFRELCQMQKVACDSQVLEIVKNRSFYESPVQIWCMIQDAWGWCTGMTQRDGMGREEEGGSGWGTCVYPWRIHVDVWQNQ